VNQVTPVMVTHIMRQALDCGTRTIMLREGRIFLEIDGPTRADLEVLDLVARLRPSAASSRTIALCWGEPLRLPVRTGEYLGD
jgi:ABC-type uncharacterized transport system ATPase component